MFSLLPVKLPFPIWGQILHFFFHLRLSTIPLLPTWEKQVCAPALPFRNVHFPPRPGAASWSCWPLAMFPVQVEMWLPCRAPAGIYRHIMPSRGQSFFPSCRSSWDPCWPSITCDDSAHSSWWFMAFLFLFWVVCSQTRPRRGNYLDVLNWWLQLFSFNKPAGVFFLSSVKWSVPPEKPFWF